MIEYLRWVSIGFAFVPFNWVFYAERRGDGGALLCVGPLRFAFMPYLDLSVSDPRRPKQC